MVAPLFGWSAGDVVQLIKIVHLIFKNVRGAKEQYNSSLKFLNSFGIIITRLEEYVGTSQHADDGNEKGQVEGDDEYAAAIAQEAAAMKAPWMAFRSHLEPFEAALGEVEQVLEAEKGTPMAGRESQDENGSNDNRRSRAVHVVFKRLKWSLKGLSGRIEKLKNEIAQPQSVLSMLLLLSSIKRIKALQATCKQPSEAITAETIEKLRELLACGGIEERIENLRLDLKSGQEESMALITEQLQSTQLSQQESNVQLQSSVDEQKTEFREWAGRLEEKQRLTLAHLDSLLSSKNTQDASDNGTKAVKSDTTTTATNLTEWLENLQWVVEEQQMLLMEYQIVSENRLEQYENSVSQQISSWADLQLQWMTPDFYGPMFSEPVEAYTSMLPMPLSSAGQTSANDSGLLSQPIDSATYPQTTNWSTYNDHLHIYNDKIEHLIDYEEFLAEQDKGFPAFDFEPQKGEQIQPTSELNQGKPSPPEQIKDEYEKRCARLIDPSIGKIRYCWPGRKATPSSKYMCFFCYTEFQDCRALQNHMANLDQPKAPQQCEECPGEIFVFQDQAEAHRQKAHAHLHASQTPVRPCHLHLKIIRYCTTCRVRFNNHVDFYDHLCNMHLGRSLPPSDIRVQLSRPEWNSLWKQWEAELAATHKNGLVPRVFGG